MAKGGVFVLGQIWQRVVIVVWVLTVIFVLAAIPWMIIEMSADGWELQEILQTIAGFFALGAIIISMYLATMHLQHFNDPDKQKHIIRVLFMVPIYALNAWLALMYQPGAVYFDTIRKNYEAFALYSFFAYVVAALGGEEELVAKLVAKEESPEHIFPLCCLFTWDVGESFYKGVRTGIHLYVFSRVVTSLVAIILYQYGLYKEGDMDVNSGYCYMCIINYTTSMWAIYCLVIFYLGLDNELNRIGALAKFLCIKCVIFFAWWQAVILAIMQQAGALPSEDNFSANEISVSIQDFCICVEMLFLALAHTWAFPYKEFSQFTIDEGESESLVKRAAHTLDFRDMGQEVLDSARNPVLPEVDRQSIVDHGFLKPTRSMKRRNSEMLDANHLPPMQEEPTFEYPLVQTSPSIGSTEAPVPSASEKEENIPPEQSATQPVECS